MCLVEVFLKIWEIQGLENDAREARLPEAQMSHSTSLEKALSSLL